MASYLALLCLYPTSLGLTQQQPFPSHPDWAAAGGPGLRSCQTVTKASSIDANPEVQLPATFVKIETPEHRQVMKPLLQRCSR